MTTDKTALDACRHEFEDWYRTHYGLSRDEQISGHSDFIVWRAAWNTRPKPSGDAVKALDALKFIGENTSAYPNPYNPVNGLNEAFQTIHAALTQPKADVEGLKRDVFTALYPHHRYEPEHNPLVLLKDCIDHLAAQGYIGVPQWQPIETAPKPIGFEEVWILGSDGTDVRTTRWCTEYPCTRGVWFLNYEPTDYISSINYWFPIYWMPLPAAPKKEGCDG